jgi:hypothetical protein
MPWGQRVIQAGVILRMLLAGFAGITSYYGTSVWLVPQLNNALPAGLQIPSPQGNIIVGAAVALLTTVVFVIVFGLGVKFGAPIQTFGGGTKRSEPRLHSIFHSRKFQPS